MSAIRYISTRGSTPALSFEEAVLAGLAPDGGLFVPTQLPTFTPAEIAGLQGLSYPELAFAIISRFTCDDVAPDALERMIADSYKTFHHPAIAPLVQLDAHTHLLELFHGPTLAFKDFALQFLGRLLAHLLEKRGQKAVVLGATSGDTGSAAIAGCAGYDAMQIVILHPKGRVSDIQRRQMTTVLADNVHNLAVEGTFDDCQAMVKALFTDATFRDAQHLVAINSINWARILAQIVYYFYAALTLGDPARRVSFAVPTGNFGDIYAGYLAKRMGLPVAQLIIATNYNNILTRCMETGTYDMRDVTPTLSPSMDIQVSSNFERLLFDLYDGDVRAIQALMQDLKTKKQFTLNTQAHGRLQALFGSASVDDAQTLATIKATYEATGQLIDPHTAVGLAAGQRCHTQMETPLVVLSTAHAAKFPEAVKNATGQKPLLPKDLKDLMAREERYTTIKDDSAAVAAYIAALA